MKHLRKIILGSNFFGVLMNFGPIKKGAIILLQIKQLLVYSAVNRHRVTITYACQHSYRLIESKNINF